MNKKLKILITGCGAPGFYGIFKSIKKSEKLGGSYIIGVDIDKYAYGSKMVDKFIHFLPYNNPGYLDYLENIIIEEKIDIILPLNTGELNILSRRKDYLETKYGVKVSVSSENTISILNNKYKLINFFEKHGLEFPKYELVNNLNDLKQTILDFGYPEKKVVVKLTESNGSRGVRVVSSMENKLDIFLNHKPNNIEVDLEHLMSYFSGEKVSFPELMIMEYLPGKEYSVDCLFTDKQNLIIPRLREKMTGGISIKGRVIKNKDIEKQLNKLSDFIKMEGNVGFQFKEDYNGFPKIIESNPRVQGTIVMCTGAGLNMIENNILNLIGDFNPVDLEKEINWNTRMVRYWEEVYFYN